MDAVAKLRELNRVEVEDHNHQEALLDAAAPGPPVLLSSLKEVAVGRESEASLVDEFRISFLTEISPEFFCCYYLRFWTEFLKSNNAHRGRRSSARLGFPLRRSSRSRR